jgi:hypothetical protein
MPTDQFRWKNENPARRVTMGAKQLFSLRLKADVLKNLGKDGGRPKADFYPTSRLLFEIHGFDIVI